MALIAGRVEAIEAKDQMPIKEGAIVVRLGGPQIETQRARLQAKVESLKSQVDLAHQTVERLVQCLKERFVKKDQVAASREAEIKLQLQLRQAQLSMESFMKQIHVVAPMTGIFTNRRVGRGQTVSPGDVLGEIIDRDHLRIAASLFPPDGIDLIGKEVTVRLGGNQLLVGIVRVVLPLADSAGATRVWIEGPQMDKRLYPGQTVSGEVTVEVKAAGLTVPGSAIVYDSEERPCLFVQKDGAYEPRSVKLGLVQDGWVEVLSGLEQDQSVVTQGAYELFYRRFNEQFKVRD